MSKVLTIGEAMGLLIAEEIGPLEEVEHFSRHVCGAELNYAVGMARLGNDVSYISKVGVDPSGSASATSSRPMASTMTMSGPMMTI